jgi:hypothetical protein
VPTTAVINGVSGGAAASDIQALADATVNNNYGGIMAWYGSVQNGFSYDTSSDTSQNSDSATAFQSALAQFEAPMG